MGGPSTKRAQISPSNTQITVKELCKHIVAFNRPIALCHRIQLHHRKHRSISVLCVQYINKVFIRYFESLGKFPKSLCKETKILEMGSESRQLHVFFFPMIAPGHTIPMIDIARLFAARGVKSSIISTPLNALQFSESIARDRQSGLDISIQTIPFRAVEAGLPEGCESFNSITSKDMVFSFLKAFTLLQKPLERLLEEQHSDCIVSDVFYPWTTDAANNYGIPKLVFHGTSNFSVCVAENVNRYAPETKVTSDSEIFAVPGLPDKIEITKSQLPQFGNTEIREKINEAEVKSFGVLVNSFYELEPDYSDYYSKDMGRKAWNIGPVSLYNRDVMNKAQRGNKSAIDEHYCLNWLDSKAPDSVLYVSFGSVSRFCVAQLHEIALGLEASEIPFIWVIRVPINNAEEELLPEGFKERTEGKGLIILEWAPQVLILDHPSVGGFMTHCGWNSTLEGISAGVPLITWPLFAEQFNNEKLVTQVLRTGISAGNEVWCDWLQSKEVSVTKKKVKDVVTQIMGNNEPAQSLRNRSKELAAKATRAVEEGVHPTMT